MSSADFQSMRAALLPLLITRGGRRSTCHARACLYFKPNSFLLECLFDAYDAPRSRTPSHTSFLIASPHSLSLFYSFQCYYFFSRAAAFNIRGAARCAPLDTGGNEIVVTLYRRQLRLGLSRHVASRRLGERDISCHAIFMACRGRYTPPGRFSIVASGHARSKEGRG